MEGVKEEKDEFVKEETLKEEGEQGTSVEWKDESYEKEEIATERTK